MWGLVCTLSKMVSLGVEYAWKWTATILMKIDETRLVGREIQDIGRVSYSINSSSMVWFEVRLAGFEVCLVMR